MKEPDTFNEAILRHRALIYSVCRRYSRRGLEADDLMQEVLIALWHRRGQLLAIAPSPLQASWIWRVARSTCVDLHRRTPTLLPLPDTYDPPTDDPSHRQALHQLIDLLPEPDCTIARLHLEGYEYREIAARTGLTKSNIGVRLMRIKDKLQQQWNNL